MVNSNLRRDMDVMKLMMSGYKVELVNDSLAELYVELKGPPNSPYDGGIWQVHIEIPEAYPYKSPSVGFANRIYHPNVDEMSGSVCLDVINQAWSPMYDLSNVFESFLPQLLLYPNPTDPMNEEAASLLMHDEDFYEKKVKEYCAKYAKADRAATQEDAGSSSHDFNEDEYSSSEE
ncbi:hypothetical protein SUGI_1197490 [Cryptomeria japonica]|uniref:ubiquitin-conjugating enzyme E2 5 isoform X2 n=1 Tax=Cryptomeria japonica TaxID=3369 RepID=UPI0024147F85|nr:ubiquitin-conjugating enzyme E2 5 isoform X2 [Cryptomeria japonica]GLJ55766.1 hypothetical protein SUGI_1197490 [Cryptomeria japonica]